MMKFTTTLLLLLAPVSVLASADSKAPTKAGKAPPAISKAAKTGGEVSKPLTGCGGEFTNEKIVLSNNLDCGEKNGDEQDCAVSLVGPQAEINCNGYKLSQDNANGMPFLVGICLLDGAKAINCNVEQFNTGISVTNGGEVVESNLSSNLFGIDAEFNVDSTLTIENTDASNNDYIGLSIFIGSGVEAQMNMEGNITFNSNAGRGMLSFFNRNAKLDIVINSDAFLNMNDNNFNFRVTVAGADAELNVDVREGGSFKSCGSRESLGDIVILGYYGDANVTFTGTGYTCDNVYNNSLVGTIVEPNCQVCPSI